MRAGTTDSCAYGTHSAKFRQKGRTKKSKKTFPFSLLRYHRGFGLAGVFVAGGFLSPWGTQKTSNFPGGDQSLPKLELSLQGGGRERGWL